MLTLQIENREIEQIFTEGFQSNTEKFLEFIQNSYRKKEVFEAFEADRLRFMRTYHGMKNGEVSLLSEEDADQEIEQFLENL